MDRKQDRVGAGKGKGAKGDTKLEARGGGVMGVDRGEYDGIAEKKGGKRWVLSGMRG